MPASPRDFSRGHSRLTCFECVSALLSGLISRDISSRKFLPISGKMEMGLWEQGKERKPLSAFLVMMRGSSGRGGEAPGLLERSFYIYVLRHWFYNTKARA